jgi:inosine-uridine nucleoside N-ribohydrolase
MRTPVLVDCDPGIDDAIALLLALASPELDVLGVTTVAGNQTLEKTTANALRVLEAANRADVPVAAGADRPLVRELVVAAAHGDSGLGDLPLPPPRARAVAEHAVDLLARTALESDSPVTLIALGPLTNVALLLALRPGAAEALDAVVFMGGAIAGGNMTAVAEFNVWVDPEAAARVLASGLDVTMVGLDVTLRARMTSREVERLGSGRAACFVRGLYASFARAYAAFSSDEGAPVHDAVAVAHAVRPDLLTLAPAHVAVERGSPVGRGQTVVDLRARSAMDSNARVAVDIDVGRSLELLVARISALP